MKKGKALKGIVGRWIRLGAKGSKVVDEKNADKERVWVREVEIVKRWRVEEVVVVVLITGANNALSTKVKDESTRGGKKKKR
jgi:hypothetical protein